MLILAKKIYDLDKYKPYLSANIVGDLGAGKSSYAMKVAYQVFRKKGLSEKKAWTAALNCMLFSAKDIVEWFKIHNYNNRAEITILDDASIHLSGKRWFVDSKTLTALEELLITGRTSTKALLVTCPDVDGLMRFLKDNVQYRIHIKKEQHWNREAIPRLSYRYGRNHIKGWKKAGWGDKFSCKLPDDIFQKYMKKRDRYKEAALKTLGDV